jgi:hypothetical protein
LWPALPRGAGWNMKLGAPGKAALGQSEDAAEWGGPWEGADHTEGGHTTTVPNPPPGLAAVWRVWRPVRLTVAATHP